MKCVNCKNCIGFENGYYLCYLGDSFEMVEECIANDDNMICELYIDEFEDIYGKDSNDDLTA